MVHRDVYTGNRRQTDNNETAVTDNEPERTRKEESSSPLKASGLLA